MGANYVTMDFVSADDSDFVVGGNLLAGVNFDIYEMVFLGIEGKFLITDGAESSHLKIGSFDDNVNGFTLTGVLGFNILDDTTY